MATTWDVFYVCDLEITFDALNHLKGFIFLNGIWGNDEENASLAIQLYPEVFLIPTMIVTTLEMEVLRKNYVLQVTSFSKSTSPLL